MNIYKLAAAVIEGQAADPQDCLKMLDLGQDDLLDVLSAAYRIRHHFWGRDVLVHILNNVQNGMCSEDCRYCAQSNKSRAQIHEYPMKSDSEIMAEAKNAYDSGAYRYCMVFSGQGPSLERVDHLAKLIREIKSRYPLEVCVSPGLLDEEKVKILKAAGLDRLNHNINTSEKFYPKICSSHSYEDRLETIRVAKAHGLQLCSGVIIGMGESREDIVEMALTLREFQAESIPVNFLVPIAGNDLAQPQGLTPEYCLRVLCLFRFLNPSTEIRIAAGREYHFRSLEVMALYPANSLFMDGYLNARGSNKQRTLQLIKDAGFLIKSDHGINELLEEELLGSEVQNSGNDILLKDVSELRPSVVNRQDQS